MHKTIFPNLKFNMIELLNQMNLKLISYENRWIKRLEALS